MESGEVETGRVRRRISQAWPRDREAWPVCVTGRSQRRVWSGVRSVEERMDRPSLARSPAEEK